MDKLAALINGDEIVDITGKVQTITATHKETGRVFSGNGIVVTRFNHVNGHQPIFLSFKGESRAFGKWLKNYTFADNWTSIEASEYDWSCGDMKNNVSINMKYARSICVIG